MWQRIADDMDDIEKKLREALDPSTWTNEEVANVKATNAELKEAERIKNTCTACGCPMKGQH